MLHASTTSSSIACSAHSAASLATKATHVGTGVLSTMSAIRASRSRQTSSPA